MKSLGFSAIFREVYVHRFLQRSCRTFDPEKAQLFFVPGYLTCWELRHR
jgi:hypothetical protein